MSRSAPSQPRVHGLTATVRLRAPRRLHARSRAPSTGFRSAVPLAAVSEPSSSSRVFNYRDTTPLSAGQVDDDPYGGGPGMVLRVDVVAAALDAVYGGVPEHRVIALSPQGRQLDQELVEELALEPALTLLSARFEGFDQRILDHSARTRSRSGPTSSRAARFPALALVDAVARRLPGALPRVQARSRASRPRSTEGSSTRTTRVRRSFAAGECRRFSFPVTTGVSTPWRTRARDGARA